MSEHLGRNIRRQLEKRPQPEDLAPCGDPNCAGCYDVADDAGRMGSEKSIKIHPPRSDY